MRVEITAHEPRWVRPLIKGLFLLFLVMPTPLLAYEAGQLNEGRDFVSGECYAHFSGTELVAGNDHVRRTWRIEHGRLFATSLFDEDRKVEWIGLPSELPSPIPPAVVQADSMIMRGGAGVFGPTEARSLRVELEAVGAGETVDYEFQIFPQASGIRAWVAVKGSPAIAVSVSEAGKQQDHDALEHLQITAAHPRFTQVVLRDRTDQHNELVFENEWLLHPNEAAVELQGNIFSVENTLTGEGLVFLKEAPQPEMRPVKAAFDAWVSSAHMVAPAKQSVPQATYFQVSFYGNGFMQTGIGDRWVLLTYHGGSNGRTAVLQQYQRQIRPYVAERDGLLLSNTWGDRSAGMNLNDEFVRKEIDAAKSLGVDVVQVDAGWQTGKFDAGGGLAGIREGYWKVNPHFWDPDPKRFPSGFSSLAGYAHANGMKFGLWFSPDSSDNFANWRKDADTFLKKNREEGVDSFKLDMINIGTREGELNYQALIDRMLTQSDGKMMLDLDVTAETRQGYFGNIAAGPLFVENRYTDWHRYWPHQTLRNLWKLSHFVDPVRLRMEFLNPERNTGLYPDDSLAPSHYDPACLFATTMFSSPLAWFENSGLSAGFIKAASPIIAQWKNERAEIYRGTILPIGDAPDGVTWTGFASVAKAERGGYLLLFRELNQASVWTAPGTLFAAGKYRIRVLGGEGTVEQASSGFRVTVPRTLGFIWAKLEPVD